MTVIPKLKVFWEVDLMPSTDGILVKNDGPEDIYLALEKIIYPFREYISIHAYKNTQEIWIKKEKDFFSWLGNVFFKCLLGRDFQYGYRMGKMMALKGSVSENAGKVARQAAK